MHMPHVRPIAISQVTHVWIMLHIRMHCSQSNQDNCPGTLTLSCFFQHAVPQSTLANPHHPNENLYPVKPVWTPVAILGSLGVCIYVPASRHWLISYSPIHLT